ncbi:MAG: hypothetical protein CH6_1641 [Candidatus Kapaibacterium sp.]|nr:MAG: hypothetical protein CH6_1641 [Candidatus Kapabacteria bacterium]
MKKILIIALFVLTLSGCKFIDFVLHPDQYHKSSKVRVTEYVYDTIKVANKDGNVTTAVAGLPNKRVVLSEIGQSFTIKKGEIVEFIFNIDVADATLDITTDLETNDITFKLVQKDTAKVYLTSKCQTVKRYQVGAVPAVEVSPNLRPEQIISTPLFDNNCQMIGYEIRYGSEERGCKKEASEALKRFVECTKYGFKPTNPQQKKRPCVNELLGLPCK